MNRSNNTATMEPAAIPRARVAARAEELIRLCDRELREHHDFIRFEGVDPPDITDWTWRDA